MNRAKQWWCGKRYKHNPSTVVITDAKMNHVSLTKNGLESNVTVVRAEKRCLHCGYVRETRIGMDVL